MRYCLYFVLLLMPLYCAAQTDKTLNWIKYSNQLKLNDKWQLNSQVDNRRRINPSEQAQLLLRLKLSRKLTERLTMGQGLVYNIEWSGSAPEAVPEWRPFQDVVYMHQLSRFDFGYRFRLEEQFIRETSGNELLASYLFILRTRYRAQVSYQLRNKNGEKGNWALQLQEELMLNLNRRRYFEENRLLFGVVHQPLESWAVELGYMYQRVKNAGAINNNSVIRLTLNHYLEL